MSIFEDQKEFMLAGGQSVDKCSYKQIGLYERLIEEEYRELIFALSEWTDDDIGQAEVIKETIDCIVVLSGALLSMGIDADKAWNLVHSNNMSKVNNNDPIVKDINGKIQKSPESIRRKAEMMTKLQELCSS